MNRICTALLVLLLGAGSAAAQQEVTLSVTGMSCITCPITVRKALEKVPGVTSVTLANDQAVVVLEDLHAESPSPDMLIRAVTRAGYSATLVEGVPDE